MQYIDVKIIASEVGKAKKDHIHDKPFKISSEKFVLLTLYPSMASQLTTYFITTPTIKPIIKLK